MIYLGCDHGGFDLKEKIKKWLDAWGYQWEDLGNTVYDQDDDYPHFAFRVGQKVAGEEAEGKSYPYPWKDRPKGILCCRSAAGMVIAANKIKGVRGIAAYDSRSTHQGRLHNDANVIGLSGDWLEENLVKEIIKSFLTAEFSGEERHTRRIKIIKDFES